MRKLTFLLTFFMLLGSVQLQAKEYAIKDIPMVHLQNRTRYVSNPDSILSSTAVTTMDSILYALEQKTGIQTLVVAVTGIEGGDCFDFAHRLGQETGRRDLRHAGTPRRRNQQRRLDRGFRTGGAKAPPGVPGSPCLQHDDKILFRSHKPTRRVAPGERKEIGG